MDQEGPLWSNCKKIVRKYNDISLIKRIIVGLVVGVVLALLIPIAEEPTGVNAFIVLFGDIFVGALKGVAPILVFFLVLSALSNSKGKGTMGTVVVLYIVSTFVAAIVAVVASYILSPLRSRWTLRRVLTWPLLPMWAMCWWRSS